MIVGFDRVVGIMKKGEFVFFIVVLDYGFGDVEMKCDLVIVFFNFILIYELELVLFVKVSWFWK